MMRGQETKVYVINKSRKFLDAQNNIMARLKKRHTLRQVGSEDECDVIISFIPIVSRNATDITAALQNIPPHRPAVLVVFHGTFNPDLIFPESQRALVEHVDSRENVCAADFLLHEDQGLLDCITNETALKHISDFLVSVVSSNDLAAVNPPWQRMLYMFISLLLVSLLIIILLLVFLFILPCQRKDLTPSTINPNITVTTEKAATTK